MYTPIDEDITKAEIIEINDECIKRIILYCNRHGDKADVSIDDPIIRLADEGTALIEFQNGRSLLFGISEWGNLQFFEKQT